MSFFSMGGYAAYVWPSFGAAAAILFALFYFSRRTLKAREAEMRALEARRDELQAAAESQGSSQ